MYPKELKIKVALNWMHVVFRKINKVTEEVGVNKICFVCCEIEVTVLI